MMRRLRWLFGGLTACALALATMGLAQGPVEAIAPTPTPRFEEVCDAVLTRAIAFTERRCGETGRNEACYGYTQVTAEFQPDVDASQMKFDGIGDIVPVRSLARIETQGLNIEDATWGMAVLKLQANLPNTNPGQNVTFILYGNTSLSPAAGKTNAFYLSTELGELTCNQLPSSSLVVRAPGHIEVAFTLNDVEISLASTLVLTAANSALNVQVLEGHASVTAQEETQEMVAGQEVAVPLDTVTGNAAGVPSEPVTFEHEPVMDTLGGLADSVSGEAMEGPITLQGPIELIDAERGWLTVDGRRVKLDPEQLAGLEIGQPYTFTGYARGFIAVELPPGVTVPLGGQLPTQTLGAVLDGLDLGIPGPGGLVLPSATFTATASRTPTDTPTRTPSNTPTRTPTDTPTRTPTDTPTRTPTPTETPTDTPTLVPTDTPAPTNTASYTPNPPTETVVPFLLTDTQVPTLAGLALAPQCSPDPASVRVWSVYNPNPVDVAFVWNVRNSVFGQTGGGTAPVNGTAGFTTITEMNSNTVDIWVNGVLNSSHSGNSNPCQ